jgi:hypothetical protein
MQAIRISRIVCILFIWLAIAVGCTGHLWPHAQKAPIIRTKEFVVVTAKTGDTFPSLAQTYLKDTRQWQRIAAYNHIDAIAPGQRLVIPLQPTVYGGLQPNGYQTVPILLYPFLTRGAAANNALSADDFERQIRYLKAAKFNAISLNQFYRFLELKEQLPAYAVMLSFDSADRWIYEIALPILRRHKFRAALFIPVDQIDKPEKLTWVELSEMATQGFEIGVLGKDITLSPDKDPDKYLSDLEREIVAAKKAIEQYLTPPCHYYAYPNGKPDDLTIALLKKHGFCLGFTHKRGSNPFFVNNFGIRRSVISGHSSMQQFQKNLTTFCKAPLK